MKHLIENGVNMSWKSISGFVPPKNVPTCEVNFTFKPMRIDEMERGTFEVTVTLKF